VCERIRLAFVDVFLHHPEVKCLSATVCWHGNLNDAQINHGIWIGPDGVVQSPDGVIGSIFQTLKMLDEQLGRGMQLAQYFRDQITTLGNEALKQHEELKKVEEALTARKAKIGAG
jgi:hypothetical protein